MVWWEPVTRWEKGERAVEYLVSQGRLESFEAEDLGAMAEALAGRAALRVEATAAAALAGGDFVLRHPVSPFFFTDRGGLKPPLVPQWALIRCTSGRSAQGW